MSGDAAGTEPDRPVGSFLVVESESIDRVRQFHDAGINEFKTSHFIGGPIAVLRSSNHAQAVIAVAFKLQHHINQVLKHARSSDGSILGYMTDQNRGDGAFFGDSD